MSFRLEAEEVSLHGVDALALRVVTSLINFAAFAIIGVHKVNTGYTATLLARDVDIIGDATATDRGFED